MRKKASPLTGKGLPLSERRQMLMQNASQINSEVQKWLNHHVRIEAAQARAHLACQGNILFHARCGP